MSWQWKPLLLGVSFASAINLASAQTRGIDPDLLSKANGGDAVSQLQVAMAYEQGAVVDRDYGQAAAWLKRSVAQGNAAAECELASLFRHGQGVAHDDSRAAGLYRMAADQGLASAEFNLGLLYNHGEGVPPDQPLAA